MRVWSFISLFCSFASASLFDFSDGTLQARLKNIKFNQNHKNAFSGSIELQLPEYTHMQCEQVDNLPGLAYRVCRVNNVCFSASADFRIGLKKPNYLTENLPVSISGPFKYAVNEFFMSDGGISCKDRDQKILFIENEVIIFSRYLTTNFYHRMHDDILPLIELLASNSQLAGDTDRLLFVTDPWSLNQQSELYNMIGRVVNGDFLKQLVRANNLDSQIVCFRNAWAGVPRKTLWYRSGLGGNVFGPEKLFSSYVIGKNMRIITNWFKEHIIHFKKDFDYKYVYDGLLNNKNNVQTEFSIGIIRRNVYRKILNESELISALSTKYSSVNITIMEEEQYEQSIRLIKQASETFFLIGVHGALLTSALFMPAQAIVVEIMPYAVSTNVMGYYEVLADLPHMNLHYRHLMSPEKGPTGRLDSYRKSSLSNVPPSYADGIKRTKEIPNHRCCRSTFKQYRFGQDVIADVDGIVTLFEEMMQETLNKN